jgi:hypothetical protein
VRRIAAANIAKLAELLRKVGAPILLPSYNDGARVLALLSSPSPGIPFVPGARLVLPPKAGTTGRGTRRLTGA